MSDRPDNPLLLGRWYTVQTTFSGNYTENSDFVSGREYRYCGSSHSHYDSATSMRFRDRTGAPVDLWWEDGEPASLLSERFGNPGGGFWPTPLGIYGLIFAVAGLACVLAYGLGMVLVALFVH